jgi:hypothetical protein
MKKLATDEIIFINDIEGEHQELLAKIDTCKRFNVGDYLVRYINDKVDINSYNVERKFQVVFVDKNGIAYIKELYGNKGQSNIMCMIHHDGMRYELDPLYEDSIIMSQEQHYDPTSLHKDKSKLFKEITKYNKSIKIKFHFEKDLVRFLSGLKVGDTLWFSNVTSFLVQQVDLSRKTLPTVKGTTNRGKVINLDIDHIRHKAIYTACPRSYKELKK